MRSHSISRRSNRISRHHRRASALLIETLEDRTVMSATHTLGGLEFVTPSQFNTETTPAGVELHTDGPVEIGMVPSDGETFEPLLRVTGGISFEAGDSAGHFTAEGELVGIVGGLEIPLAGAAEREFTASSLFDGIDIGGGKSLSVAGAQFTISGIDLDQDAVKLQGRLAVPQLAGLEVAVQGDDYVVVGKSGVQLTALDVSVSELSFTRGGLGFNLGNLNVHYSTVDNSFAFTGNGSVMLAGREIGIALGSDETAGLVIANGQFQSLDMAVTTNFNLGGMSFIADDLRLAYSTTDDAFRITGTAGAAVGTSRMNVTFAADGGIVIEHGQLTHLDAAINGEFHLMGLTVAADNLGLTYDAADDRFGVFGSANVSTAGGMLDHVGATLGDSIDNPGLVIWEGRVEELDIAVDGSVKVGGLALTSEGLTLRYDAPSGNIQLVGGLRLDVGPKLSAAAILTGDGMTINSNTGAVSVNGIRFEADAELGPVVVKNLVVEYQKTSTGESWLAQGEVQLFPGVMVGGASRSSTASWPALTLITIKARAWAFRSATPACT